MNWYRYIFASAPISVKYKKLVMFIRNPFNCIFNQGVAENIFEILVW